MAVIFELVVNFGDNVEAARASVLAERRPWTLKAGAHQIPLHKPLLNTNGPYVEVSIIPVAVGWGVPLDGTLSRFQLNAAELAELGHQLYGLLATFDGYVCAKVGWDPEDFLDPDVLRSDYAEDLRDGRIDGLVLSEQVHASLGLDADYAEFRPGYRWIPFRGIAPNAAAAD